MSDEERLVSGLQPAREAIRVHRDRVRRVLVEDRNQPKLEGVARFARDQGIVVERVPRATLDRMSGGAAHQGVVAIAPPLTLQSAESLLADPGLIAIALDGVQDPQNFGAAVRSAVAIAGAAVIWGEHSSAPLSPATFRASAGAIEHARLCRVRSLVALLDEAKTQGVTVVGLEASAPTQLREVNLAGPTLIVLGGEHEGLGRAVKRTCTTLARLVPMFHVDSLNVSVAAAIALYEARVQRGVLGTSISSLE
jgi:23S rRNA (guanosine2251-2'-O)-methyltransferase